MYFSSLTSLGTSCLDNDVGLDQLNLNLKTPTVAPAMAFIVPNPCHDGSDNPSAPKAPSGLAAADRFLRKLVPQIQHRRRARTTGSS